MSTVAKKCRSAWNPACSEFGQPAAARHLPHSRDQILSVIGFPVAGGEQQWHRSAHLQAPPLAVLLERHGLGRPLDPACLRKLAGQRLPLVRLGVRLNANNLTC